MLRRALLLPALAGLAQAQTITSSASYNVVATPDALPVADLRDFDIPTYSIPAGLDEDIVYYTQATAVAQAAADQSASPLSVFPAVTAVPINAAGNDDSTDAAKRGLQRRSACDPQPTIANYYNVMVDTYSNFKADPTISSVAMAAPTPSGYFNNFKNAPGANSAYAYMGYATVNKGQTGYDTNWCAQKCTSMSGCLAFNIFFERDPVLEPGSACPNPAAFATIKCSFWGSALDSTTANNYGQWRNQFQVGVAGSNAYTSFKVGGPINGWSPALSLNTSTMNAPLYDCSNTWTYLGYKLFQSGPYDPQLCSAACDAQTAYNLANPPPAVNGKAVNPVQCAAFGSYLLTMTNKTSSYGLGQMCTFYTSAWDAKYAVNSVSYDDSIGAKYTYSFSFYYSKPNIQPICQSDIDSLVSSGGDFCTSFNGYSAPVVTVTPAVVTDTVTNVVTQVSIATGSPTATITGNVNWKRDDSTAAPLILNNTATYSTVASVPASSAVVLGEYTATMTATNGTLPTDAPDNLVLPSGSSPATKRAVLPRAIATPANIAGWPSTRIAEACSEVATGTITSTLVASHTSVTVSATAVTTLQACVVPSENPDYTQFTPVWGSWSGDTLVDLGYAVAGVEQTLQLPFPMKFGTTSSNTISIATNGYIRVGSNSMITAFAGQGGALYIYSGSNGVFYRITGQPGSRQLVVAWYAGTYNYGHMQEHFTITYFEATGTIQYKYYDVVQSGKYQAAAYIVSNGVHTDVNTYQPFNAGDQFQIKVGSDDTAQVVRTEHNRVDCCTKRPDNWFGGWHSCTEFQPPIEN